MHILSLWGSQIKVLLEERKYNKENKKGKENAVEDIVYDNIFLGDDERLWRNKTINKKIEENFIPDSISTSHIMKSLSNIKTLQEVKTVVKSGNKKIMMG